MDNIRTRNPIETPTKYFYKSRVAFIGVFHPGLKGKLGKRNRSCKVGKVYRQYEYKLLPIRLSAKEPYHRKIEKASLEKSFRDKGNVNSQLLEGADESLDRKYRHWRIRIFYSIFIGYAFYYFTRNSFTYVAPAMRIALGFNLQQLGVITSIFPLAYGFSKLASGILADRFSTRLFMSAGLAITGILNILFGLSSHLYILCLLWALNGVFQGFGAPPCARLLTQWYSRTERGTWWGFWNTSHNTGGFLIPLVAGYFATKYGWKYGMIAPGILGLAMSCFLYNRLRDGPETVGLPPIHVYRDDAESDQSSSSSVEKHEKLSFWSSLRRYVFSNPYVWLLALSYFFIYFIRQGISSWAHVFLLDFKGVASPQEAAFRVSGMEIGGLMGSLVSGWASDRMLRGRRIPIIILWLVGVLVSVVSLWYIPGSFRYVTWMLIFSIGFFIYGPQMLVGLAGAEIVHKDAVSTTIGFLGWIAYLGASFAGFPLTSMITRYGWQAYFTSLMGCGIVAILLLIPMWRLGMGEYVKKPLLDQTKDAFLTACEFCAGTGTIIRLSCGPATPAQAISCRYVERPCPYCGGNGVIQESPALLPFEKK